MDGFFIVGRIPQSSIINNFLRNQSRFFPIFNSSIAVYRSLSVVVLVNETLLKKVVKEYDNSGCCRYVVGMLLLFTITYMHHQNMNI